MFSDHIVTVHKRICGCNDWSRCVRLYRRCKLRRKIFHSLVYTKRGSTLSYFVQYADEQHKNFFGVVLVFFTCLGFSYAVIERHADQGFFSDRFCSSPYHSILEKTLNVYFHSLNPQPSDIDIIHIENLIGLCIVFEDTRSLIVTPLSACHEHD